MKDTTEEERKARRRQYEKELRLKNLEKHRERGRLESKKSFQKPERKEYARQFQLKKYRRDIEAGRKAQRDRYKRRRERDPEEVKKNNFRRAMKKRHGITVDRYQEIFSGQNFACAICKTTDPGDRRGWQLDHCHATGTIRGILCRHCNLMLGYAKDNASALIAAAEYIKTSQSDNFVGFGISNWKPSPSARKKSNRPSQTSVSVSMQKCADDLFSI